MNDFKRITQKERVLALLKEVGTKGIHSFLLIKEISHKAPTRISELRKEGWNIKSVPEKLGRSIGCRYFLDEHKEKKTIDWSKMEQKPLFSSKPIVRL